MPKNPSLACVFRKQSILIKKGKNHSKLLKTQLTKIDKFKLINILETYKFINHVYDCSINYNTVIITLL